MKKLTIVIILLSSVMASAQVRKFKWSTMTCEFEGTYNSKKYTVRQLRDTATLLTGGLPLEADATPREIADIGKLDIAALDREYAEKSAALKNLQLVKLPYWENQRRKKLRELDVYYTLSRATMLSFTQHSILKSYQGVQACVKEYAGPLAAGGDSLLTTWKKVNEASRARNSMPERLERIFNEQMASPDRQLYARMEVTAFGWWNCANHETPYVEYDGTQEKEFRKLFTRVKTLWCDEP